MTTITVHPIGNGVRFQVRVQPRASRTEVAGTYAGALRVRLQAPPVDGAANEALVEFLAERLGVPRREVRVVSGLTSRSKVVEVAGVASGQVERLITGR